MKAMLVICDGLGDRPVKELGNKTPLEAAKTPNLDRLAKEAITGIMDTFEVGTRPGSDTAHLSLLGYDIEKYYTGRGPFEVLGIGMDLKEGDVALRANVGTIDKNQVVIDRRAGRIRDTTPFADAIDGMKIDGIKFLAKPGTGHRIGIVMRGKGLSNHVSDIDPHKTGVKVLKSKALNTSKKAKFTANLLNKFTAKSSKLIEGLPINEERKKKGLPPGNAVLTRGAGYVVEVPGFMEKYGLKAACIAGAGLYKGVGRYTGMDVINVKGATGLPDTNVAAKFRAAKQALKEYDFVMVHVKAADSLGEDGNWAGKKEFIEKIDRAAKELLSTENTFIAVTADHSTPCSLKVHSGDPVPLLIWGDGVRTDSVKQFGERACAVGCINRINGYELMKEFINLLGKATLFGD